MLDFQQAVAALSKEELSCVLDMLFMSPATYMSERWVLEPPPIGKHMKSLSKDGFKNLYGTVIGEILYQAMHGLNVSMHYSVSHPNLLKIHPLGIYSSFSSSLFAATSNRVPVCKQWDSRLIFN